LYFDWSSGTVWRVPDIEETAVPSTTPSSSDTSSHRQASLHPHKHKQPASSPDDMEEMTIEPDGTTNPPAPATTATISMATPGDSSGSAEKAIATTSDRLARFDRSRLKGPILSTYDQANGFLNQGKQALAEKDYVAAAGFAQKASALADRLQEATVSAR
jgi:septal ring-binding cell division protein DamX